MTLFVVLGLRVVVTILKSKHLRRLLIVEHVIVVLQLMRHLSVHLRSILMWMLNMMIFAFVLIVDISGSIAKFVSSSVSSLHPIRSL